MPTRVQVVQTFQMVLLAGLLLGAGEAANAQSTANPSSQPMLLTAPVSAASGISPEPQTPSDARVKFEDLVKMAQDEGKYIVVRDDLSRYFDLAGYAQMPPDYLISASVHAYALMDDNSPREMCVTKDHKVLFITVAATGTTAYLASDTGALQGAAKSIKGRWGNDPLKAIPLRTAAEGFGAEKAYWLKKIASMKAGDAAKFGQAVSKSN